MEIIAHRYGNRADTLESVEGIADLIELDVHRRRGRVEVRHAKRLWLTRRHWERWYLVPAGTRYPELGAIIAGADPGTRFWIDCKGPDPRLADAIERVIAPGRAITVSSKAWWVLHRFADRAHTRIIRSAGNRLELFVLRYVPSRVRLDGVVVHERLLDRRTLAALLARFGQVFTWAVVDRGRAEELQTHGVSGVILDDLDLIRELADGR